MDPDAVMPAGLDETQIQAIDDYCRSRQTAVLAIMFTDVKGSSRLAENLGEEASQTLRQTHDRLLRQIIERDGAGTCLKNIGDSLLCIFAKPTDAVARAVEIQQALERYNREDPRRPSIIVRIGIHMGQVVVEDHLQPDVFGRHVNRAARIESLADGKQILVSHSVFDNASGWINDAKWIAHGEYVLKGIREPERIVEVVYSGGPPPRRPQGCRKVRRPALVVAMLAIIALIAASGTMALLHVPAPLTVKLAVASRRADAPQRRFPTLIPVTSNDQFRFTATASRSSFLRIVYFDPADGWSVLSSSNGNRADQISTPTAPNEYLQFTGRPGHRMVVALASDQPIDDRMVMDALALTPRETADRAPVLWFNSDGTLLEESGDRGAKVVSVSPGLASILSSKMKWFSDHHMPVEGVAFRQE